MYALMLIIARQILSFCLFYILTKLSWKSKRIIHFFKKLFVTIINFNFMLQEIKLGPNTRSYDVWKTPPIPMYFDIYLFNWTNPSNFSSDEAFPKPILKEIGPYRFVEKPDKEDIVWNDNQTVSFRKKSTFFFDVANSKGRMDDMITTLNIVALVSITHIQ